MLAIAAIKYIYNDVGGIEHHVPSHHQEYGILDSLKIMIPKIMLTIIMIKLNNFGLINIFNLTDLVVVFSFITVTIGLLHLQVRIHLSQFLLPLPVACHFQLLNLVYTILLSPW